LTLKQKELVAKEKYLSEKLDENEEQSKSITMLKDMCKSAD